MPAVDLPDGVRKRCYGLKGTGLVFLAALAEDLGDTYVSQIS
jgi:hypothetical protein